MRTLLPRTLCAAALLVSPVLAGEEAVESPITFGVSPPRFEVEIGAAPTTHAVRVFNFGTEAVEISISVRSWELDDANKVRIVEPTEQSLDQWIVINPLRFEVAPGEFQTVRFSIRPKVQPQPGEHRAMLYFEQPAAAHGSLMVRGRMGIAVYAYAGSVERVGRLNGVSVRPGACGPVADFDISSEGSAHVRLDGQYALWRADAYPGPTSTGLVAELGKEGTALPSGIVHAGYLPALPVLPGDRRSIPLYLPPDLAQGDYVLDLNGDLSGAPVDLAVPFTVAPRDDARASTR